MRAVVLVSTVQNPEETLRSKGETLEIIEENEIINDFDLIAVEKAVQLKEAGCLDEVIVFSLSSDKKHLLKVLAMGADRAVWGQVDHAQLTPSAVVVTALKAIPADSDTIWMLGKMGVNYESHFTGQLLSTALDVPCLASCYQIACNGETWHVDCEDECGTAHYAVKPPFVVTSELRLAEPRFPALPSLIRAKKKPIESIEVVLDAAQHLTQKLALADTCHRECRMISADEFCSEIQQKLNNMRS